MEPARAVATARFPRRRIAARGVIRRDLRAITGDGVAFSVMVGAGESYLAAFVLAAGLGDVASGLVATLPVLAGAVLQLVTPRAVATLGSFRRWVVACATLQALSLLPLAVGAATGWVPLWLPFACGAAYWAFGMGTGPAWNTWVGTLVPRRLRARFFASRTRAGQSALVIALLAAGLALEAGRGRGIEMVTFALLFAAAALARLVSSRFLAAQSEPVRPEPALRLPPLATFVGRLGRGPDGRLLAHLLSMQLAVHVAAPFFVPYMLGPLDLSYATFTLYTAAAFAGRVAALPMLGRVAERRGAGALLWVGAGGVVPLPVLWLVSDAYFYLLGLQLFAGVMWAAFELATLVSILEHVPERERTGVLTWYNLASALAIGTGSVAGGVVFVGLGGAGSAYAALFVGSSALRALSLLLLRRIRTATLDVELAPLRTLAVRPSAGAVQRPIVAALPPHEDDPDGRSDAASGGVS